MDYPCSGIITHNFILFNLHYFLLRLSLFVVQYYKKQYKEKNFVEEIVIINCNDLTAVTDRLNSPYCCGSDSKYFSETE